MRWILVALACSVFFARPAVAAPIAQVTARAFAAQKKDAGAALLDVSDEATRTKTGIIEGAHLLYGVLSDGLGSRLPADKARPLVFYGSGDDAAARMAARAIESGHANVSVLAGGVAAWAAAGLPLRKIPAAPTAMSPSEVQALAQGDRAVLVDVREAPERREVIHESMWIPYSRLESEDARWAEPLQLRTRKQTVIFYCTAGIRSRRAAELFRERGYASRYFDGPVQWRAAGLAVESGPAR